ncbi:MAG: YceI family protein [Bacteroidales bacterium]|nr:YceI family protein [Bacteroidales bacterium]
MMKKLNSFITIAIALLILPVAGRAQKTLQIDKKNSEVRITGTSTLHDWEINVEGFHGSVKGTVATEEPSITGSELICLVKSFESGKNKMNNIVYETLQAEEHPRIRFNYKRIKQIQPTNMGDQIKVVGDLTIAGQTREMEITMDSRLKDGMFSVSGSKTFKMSSFGIEPPSVMFGTIKSGDKVTVHFSINYN